MKTIEPKWLFLIAAALFGSLIYALLPQGIIAFNDDFAYLRSVVETLQRGRPWTDDWLEPWAAGFSTISALLFKISGSFYAATYGLLAISAGASFFIICQLLHFRRFTWTTTIQISLLFLTWPTMLWKQVEFTGVALYLPCLLGALWTAETRKWGRFSLFLLLAISTRQSAVVWCVLPIAAIIEDKRRLIIQSWRQIFWPSMCVAAGFVSYYSLGYFMNNTTAQRVYTDKIWTNWSITQASHGILVGGIALSVAIGSGAWLQRLNRENSTGFSQGWRVTFGVACAGLLLLGFQISDHVAFEQETFNSASGHAILTCVAVIGLLGLGHSYSLRLIPLSGALAAIAVVTTRGVIWDYYLFDICLLGLLAVGNTVKRVPELPPFRWMVRVLACFLLVFQFTVLIRIKSSLDRMHALTDLGTRTLEERRLPPNQASFLPFGVMAWYFFPLQMPYFKNDGADPADFGAVLDHSTVSFAWRYSQPLRWLPNHNGGWSPDRNLIIIEGKFNYCWLYGVEVQFLRMPPSSIQPAKRAYPSDYRLPRFPRDDAGWRELIRMYPNSTH